MAALICRKISVRHKGKAINPFIEQLCINNYRLLNLINKETLNSRYISNADMSLAEFLSKSEKGKELLFANNRRLLNLIENDVLRKKMTEENPLNHQLQQTAPSESQMSLLTDASDIDIDEFINALTREEDIFTLLSKITEEIRLENYQNLFLWENIITNRDKFLDKDASQKIVATVKSSLFATPEKYTLAGDAFYCGYISQPFMNLPDYYASSSEDYFKKASRLGNSMAKEILAVQSSNEHDSLTLRKEAVELNNPLSVCYMALQVKIGSRSIEKNETAAIAQLDNAIHQGNSLAMYQRARIYLESPSNNLHMSTVISLLEKAITLDNMDAHIKLGALLIGQCSDTPLIGLILNPSKGESLLKKAASCGYFEAMVLLCRFYASEENKQPTYFMFYYEILNRYSDYNGELLNEAKKIAETITSIEAHDFLHQVWISLKERITLTSEGIEILEKHCQSDIVKRLMSIEDNEREQLALLTMLLSNSSPIDKVLSNHEISQPLKPYLQALKKQNWSPHQKAIFNNDIETCMQIIPTNVCLKGQMLPLDDYSEVSLLEYAIHQEFSTKDREQNNFLFLVDSI